MIVVAYCEVNNDVCDLARELGVEVVVGLVVEVVVVVVVEDDVPSSAGNNLVAYYSHGEV